MWARHVVWIAVSAGCSYHPPDAAETDGPLSDGPLSDTAADGPASACTAVTIEASKAYDPSATMDGTHVLAAPADIVLPEILPVTTGNAGNHCAELRYTAADNSLVRCRYRGGADVSHVGKNPIQEALGKRYVFDQCRLGAACPSPNGTVVATLPGQKTPATNQFVLHIDNGDSDEDTTTAEATVEVCE